jgi:hypothetical protein
MIMNNRKYIVQLVDKGQQVAELFMEPLTLQEIIECVHDGDFPMFCRKVDTGRYDGLPYDLSDSLYRWFTDVVDVSGLSQPEGVFGDKLVVGHDRIIDRFVSLHTEPLSLTIENVLPYLEYVYQSSETGYEVKLIPVE